MSKYGFDDDLPTIALPAVKEETAKPEPEVLEKVRQAGEEIGFVDRAPGKRKPKPNAVDTRQTEIPSRKYRKPGPSTTEVPDKITIHAPKRILDAFRDHCDQQGYPYWHALAEMLGLEIRR